MIHGCKNIIIIPAYRETLALPKLLSDLSLHLSELEAVLIMDDSPEEIAMQVKLACQRSMKNSKAQLFFFNHGKKSGRGAAVRRGMAIALIDFPKLEYVIECDADGSHQASDILRVVQFGENADLLVGSRYLPTSEILGWPLSRRIFSLFLNRIIPRLINVPLKDITNGLRRYSRNATEVILSREQKNYGFIYLSEQAQIVSDSGLKVSEIPITFIDRTLGESTVTWHEITQSMGGVLSLLRNRRTN